jgi:hypothetical protein
MNGERIREAFQKALETGVSPVTTTPWPESSDFAILSREHDVQINSAALDELVSILRAEPPFDALEQSFIWGALSGGSISIDLSSLAKTLLARCLKVGNVDSVLAEFSKVVESNEAMAAVAIALPGIEVSRRIDLGGQVSLVPLDDLPASIGRAAARGQSMFSSLPREVTSKSALVTEVTVRPLLSKKIDEKAVQRAVEQLANRTKEVAGTLTDACNCMGLACQSFPPYPYIRWAVYLEAGAVFESCSGSYMTYTVDASAHAQKDIDLQMAQDLCHAFFSLDATYRVHALRIPLARLSRARQWNSALVDKAIDLGIAVEALLLHDIGGSGELAYRLRTRAAWLMGSSPESRRDISDLMKKLYELRSDAVHKGYVDETPDNAQTLNSGIRECAALIKTVIERKNRIEWESLVLGS